MVTIKISSKSLRNKFEPCTLEYIKNVCHGRCCRITGGTTAHIHTTEISKFEKLGITIKDGCIMSNELGLCPLWQDDGLCRVHADKPLGCRFSPFKLNSNNTLIIRNRYRRLKCYNTPNSVPAYKAHAWSLGQALGLENAKKVTEHLDAGDEDLLVEISDENYAAMVGNNMAYSKKKPVSHEFWED